MRRPLELRPWAAFACVLLWLLLGRVSDSSAATTAAVMVASPPQERAKRSLTTICVEIKPTSPQDEPFFMCKGADFPALRQQDLPPGRDPYTKDLNSDRIKTPPTRITSATTTTTATPPMLRPAFEYQKGLEGFRGHQDIVDRRQGAQPTSIPVPMPDAAMQQLFPGHQRSSPQKMQTKSAPGYGVPVASGSPAYEQYASAYDGSAYERPGSRGADAAPGPVHGAVKPHGAGESLVAAPPVASPAKAAPHRADHHLADARAAAAPPVSRASYVEPPEMPLPVAPVGDDRLRYGDDSRWRPIRPTNHRPPPASHHREFTRRPKFHQHPQRRGSGCGFCRYRTPDDETIYDDHDDDESFLPQLQEGQLLSSSVDDPLVQQLYAAALAQPSLAVAGEEALMVGAPYGYQALRGLPQYHPPAGSTFAGPWRQQQPQLETPSVTPCQQQQPMAAGVQQRLLFVVPCWMAPGGGGVAPTLPPFSQAAIVRMPTNYVATPPTAPAAPPSPYVNYGATMMPTLLRPSLPFYPYAAMDYPATVGVAAYMDPTLSHLQPIPMPFQAPAPSDSLTSSTDTMDATSTVERAAASEIVNTKDASKLRSATTTTTTEPPIRSQSTTEQMGTGTVPKTTTEMAAEKQDGGGGGKQFETLLESAKHEQRMHEETKMVANATEAPPSSDTNTQRGVAKRQNTEMPAPAVVVSALQLPYVYSV